MAADENTVEVFAALGRILVLQEDMRRAGKDYLMKSSNRFQSSQMHLHEVCFLELVCTLSYIKEKYKPGEALNVLVHGITGVILFRLNLLNDSRFSNSLLKELLLFPRISEVLKSCNPESRIVCFSVNNFFPVDDGGPRPVENPIFIQKADLYNEEDNTIARIDPGVRMDAKAVFDQGYLQRLHHNQPMYHCEHDVQSIGNTCTQCDQLALERILSVYANSFLFSKDK